MKVGSSNAVAQYLKVLQRKRHARRVEHGRLLVEGGLAEHRGEIDTHAGLEDRVEVPVVLEGGEGEGDEAVRLEEHRHQLLLLHHPLLQRHLHHLLTTSRRTRLRRQWRQRRRTAETAD